MYIINDKCLNVYNNRTFTKLNYIIKSSNVKSTIFQYIPSKLQITPTLHRSTKSQHQVSCASLEIVSKKRKNFAFKIQKKKRKNQKQMKSKKKREKRN